MVASLASSSHKTMASTAQETRTSSASFSLPEEEVRPVLRHDEQVDEAYYDDREQAEDDLEKGRIHFSTSKLYGRQDELETLQELYKDNPTQVVLVGGYSGTGKSALMETFLSNAGAVNDKVIFLAGKYEEQQSADPCSALTQAISKWIASVQEGEIKQRVGRKLANRVSPEDLGLLKNFIPNIEDLLDVSRSSTAESSATTTSSSEDSRQLLVMDTANTTTPENQLKFKYLVAKFLMGLATCGYRLVLYLDDLQWADSASLEVVQVLWNQMESSLNSTSNKKTQLCFLGAYRSNEVHEDHALRGLMKDHESKKDSFFTVMELENLSVHAVTEFLADSLNLSQDETQPLATAVHKKTLGNIFFTMQALEELVRKNVVFYDVMIFAWQWNLSPADLEGLLSDNVVDMVRSKLQSLPKSWQWVLIVAAHIRATFDAQLLHILLMETTKHSNPPMSMNDLLKILDKIVLQGLLLNPVGTSEYTFAHDRIQEVATTLIGTNSLALHELKFQMATVLERMRTEEWMLYAAVHNWNSLPTSFLQPKMDMVRLAKLNVETAQHALRVSAFATAVQGLRAAVEYLGPARAWQPQYYDLTYEIYNTLLSTEFAVGNFDQADAAIEQVLQHAKTLEEKSAAHWCCLQVIVNRPNRNYSLAVDRAIEIFNAYGMEVCRKPPEARVLKERMRMKLAMGHRNYLDLLKTSYNGDDGLLRQLEQLCRNTVYVDDIKLGLLACYISIRTSAQHGLSIYTVAIMPLFALLFRMQGKLKEAVKAADYAHELAIRCPGYTGAPACRGNVTLHACLTHLTKPFKDSLELYTDSYKQGIPNNEVEFAFTSAMNWAISYYASGLPMTSLLEPRLILFEEGSRQLKQAPSIAITFSIFRQTLMNLQGRDCRDCPTQLKGKCLDEEEALQQFTGSQYKQTFRDISIHRLLLAVVYNDIMAMGAMIRRLDSYSEFDFAFARSHNRFAFAGLAAALLLRVSSKKDAIYKKTYTQSLQFFQKFAKLKSQNAAPLVKCLKAEQKQTIKAYASAIEACNEQHWFHIEAIMNERMGRWLLEHPKDDSEKELAQSALTKSLWLYHDWGAFGKSTALRKEFDFLRNAARKGNARPSTIISHLNMDVSIDTNSMDESASHISGTSSTSGLTGL